MATTAFRPYCGCFSSDAWIGELRSSCSAGCRVDLGISETAFGFQFLSKENSAACSSEFIAGDICIRDLGLLRGRGGGARGSGKHVLLHCDGNFRGSNAHNRADVNRAVESYVARTSQNPEPAHSSKYFYRDVPRTRANWNQRNQGRSLCADHG